MKYLYEGTTKQMIGNRQYHPGDVVDISDALWKAFNIDRISRKLKPVEIVMIKPKEPSEAEKTKKKGGKK